MKPSRATSSRKTRLFKQTFADSMRSWWEEEAVLFSVRPLTLGRWEAGVCQGVMREAGRIEEKSRRLPQPGVVSATVREMRCAWEARWAVAMKQCA